MVSTFPYGGTSVLWSLTELEQPWFQPWTYATQKGRFTMWAPSPSSVIKKIICKLLLRSFQNHWDQFLKIEALNNSKPNQIEKPDLPVLS